MARYFLLVSFKGKNNDYLMLFYCDMFSSFSDSLSDYYYYFNSTSYDVFYVLLHAFSLIAKYC